MRVDFAKLSLFSAISWLVAIVVATLIFSHSVETSITQEAPLGAILQRFQAHFPVWAKVVAVAMAMLTGIVAGRLTVQHALYPVSTSLAIPLYGIVACGVVISEAYLTAFTAGFVLLLSTRRFFTSYRSEYALGTVFQGTFCLGLLPLIDPWMAPLVGLIIPAATCFRWNIREFFMALCGVVTPMLTACYVMWWRAGGEGTFCILPRQIWETLTQPHEGSWGVEGIELGGSTPAIWVAGGIGFLIVCALVSGMADFRRRGKKVQSILSYNTILFFATLGVLYLNRDIARMMPSIALSAAILMPQFLLKLKQKTLAAAFLLLICGFIAVLFVKV